MADQSKNAAKTMQKGAARIVKARLSKRAQNTIKQFCKQAQNMVDDVEPGKKSFPDGSVRSAMRALIGSLEDNLEAVRAIAEATGEDDLVEIIQDAADALSPADADEGMEEGHEEHHEPDVDVSGLSEGPEGAGSVDIGAIDERPMIV